MEKIWENWWLLTCGPPKRERELETYWWTPSLSIRHFVAFRLLLLANRLLADDGCKVRTDRWCHRPVVMKTERWERRQGNMVRESTSRGKSTESHPAVLPGYSIQSCLLLLGVSLHFSSFLNQREEEREGNECWNLVQNNVKDAHSEQKKKTRKQVRTEWSYCTYNVSSLFHHAIFEMVAFFRSSTELRMENR